MVASNVVYCGSAARSVNSTSAVRLLCQNTQSESNRNVPYDRIEHPAAAWGKPALNL